MRDKIHSLLAGSLITAFIFACLICISDATASGPDAWESDSVVVRLDTVVSTRYTKGFPMSGGANWILLTKTVDTTAAGFANDSVSFIVGYRNFLLTTNTSGKIDTVYGTATPVDTLTLARLDTASVTGWGTRATSFSPSVWRFMQLYVTTGSGQRQGKPQRAVLELQRNVGTITKGR